LVQAHEKLVAAPQDLAAKVRFVTIYHVILEATLGLTTFRFATEYLNRQVLLPGFVERYSHIHHDETRPIGYGVWFLRESVRQREDAADAVSETLRDLLPSVAEALAGAGNGSGRDVERLGVSTDDVRTFALNGLRRRSTSSACRLPAWRVRPAARKRQGVRRS
jgi:ribonucleoside-diphosphate reductase beta chain